MAFYGGVPPQNASLKLDYTAIHGGKAFAPWCRKVAVLRRFSTSSKTGRDGGSHGRLLDVGTARSAVVSKSGGTPALFDKLKNRQDAGF